jgi:hypothetical protein
MFWETEERRSVVVGARRRREKLESGRASSHRVLGLAMARRPAGLCASRSRRAQILLYPWALINFMYGVDNEKDRIIKSPSV